MYLQQEKHSFVFINYNKIKPKSGMKSVFDNATREELINRINSLNENSTPQWGKMNVYQMLEHCVRCEELYLGKRTHKRTFLGRLIGSMALKNLLKDERPLSRNAPTSPMFIVRESEGNVQSEKQKWIALVEEYEHYTNNDFVHWFFGKMTKEQVGYFVYKHTDHHLRQFNV
jgi:Protein of unknown function (DUF1569)